jgi:hypothetical protein
MNSVVSPYKLTLKDILQPEGSKVEKTTVILNDLCEALMQGNPTDNKPTYKNT